MTSIDERVVSLRCADAREEERRRMAVDLHDGPIQQLVNLVLRLDMAEKALPADAVETRTEFAALRQFAKNILQDMRRFMFELRPASLDEFSLLPVLRQYIQDFRTQYGIGVEIKLSDSDWSLGRDIEVNLFRIVQEALTNVRKHAKASKVDVVLTRQGSEVTVTVSDNGRGFDVTSVRARAQQEKKLGLASMDDRARALNGKLQIESREGRSEVRVVVPIADQGAAVDHG
jgi:two-component system sensor histidine kinase DegS